MTFAAQLIERAEIGQRGHLVFRNFGHAVAQIVDIFERSASPTIASAVFWLKPFT